MRSRNLYWRLRVYTVGAFFAVLLTASNFNRNPITETQTTPVAVTEETLKDEGKAGAPKPSFQLVEDTEKFLTSASVKKPDTKEQKRRFWWMFGRKEEPDVEPDSAKKEEY